MADQDFKDFADQFKQMHDDLDKLAKATAVQTEETKEQSKETKEQTEVFKKETKERAKETKTQNKETKTQTETFKKETKVQNQTTKDNSKDRKSILKAMQLQLRKTQMEQGASMSDVAAEHLAGGGGLLGAGKAAVGLKVAKVKHKFDPLNIVKKITGGSRLAVALAGKVMGRSEKSIRSFADLAPGMDLPTPFFGKGKGSGMPTLMGEGKGGRHGGDSQSVLTKMAVTLSLILARLTSIETIQRLTAKLTQQQVDGAKDDAAVAGAKKTPSRMGKVKEQIKESGGAAWDFIKGLIGNFKLGLLAAFALLTVAGKMLYDQWNNLKLSFGLLKDSAVDMWEGVKNAFTEAGSWISQKAIQFVDIVMDMFDSIIQGAQELLEKVSFGAYKAPTKEARQLDLEAKAKSGDARSIRKLEAQNTEKVAAPGESAAAVAKNAASFGAKVPAEAKQTAAEGLQRGDYDAAATDSLLGKAAPSGSPEQKATTSAVTQLVAKSYGEVYKDKQGNPLTPRTDTKAPERVPEMVREATKALSKTLSVAAPPTELTQTQPETGLRLIQAAENQRNAEMVGSTGGSGSATVINNVKNNNSSVTNLQQTMPDPRSGETSYLRSLDRHFAPS